MSRWFRFYENVMDDPKVQLLSDAHYRGWTTLLCIASKGDGEIPGDEAVLTFALRKPVGKVRDLLQALLSAQLIDRTETGYTPHNWNGRQFKSDVSNERVKRHRERHKTVTGNDDVTLHVTPPETEQRQSRTEQKEESSSAAIAAPPASPEFIRLPTNRFEKQGEEVIVSEAHVAEFTALFPAVDVRQQLRAMRGWLISNTDRRKTRKGMMAFANKWLSKQQNESGSNGQNGRSGAKKHSGHDAFFAATASFVGDKIREAEGSDDSDFIGSLSRPLLPS